jgi:hypothetical protein
VFVRDEVFGVNFGIYEFVKFVDDGFFVDVFVILDFLENVFNIFRGVVKATDDM